MKTQTPYDIGNELIDKLNNGTPYSATFLFLEPGCESIGQETPLAKAIEAAMRRQFLLWERTWIRPLAQDLKNL